jgi:hypothetical protein
MLFSLVLLSYLVKKYDKYVPSVISFSHYGWFGQSQSQYCPLTPTGNILVNLEKPNPNIVHSGIQIEPSSVRPDPFSKRARGKNEEIMSAVKGQQSKAKGKRSKFEGRRLKVEKATEESRRKKNTWASLDQVSTSSHLVTTNDTFDFFRHYPRNCFRNGENYVVLCQIVLCILKPSFVYYERNYYVLLTHDVVRILNRPA